MPLSDKVRLADFVIDNSGTFDNTYKQVEKLRRMLWKARYKKTERYEDHRIDKVAKELNVNGAAA